MISPETIALAAAIRRALVRRRRDGKERIGLRLSMQARIVERQAAPGAVATLIAPNGGKNAGD